MDHKTFLKNKSICTLPWSGFELEADGSVKNCVMSKTRLGNINQSSIENILGGEVNTKLKKDMLGDKMPYNCSGCHLQEKGKSDLNSISSRLYYHKELGKKIDMNFYDDVKNFSLKHVDLRWTNSCNLACVYCYPEFSSKWAQELGVNIKSADNARQEVKNYVFRNITKLENVYLAGGEPMLMKENLEFLQILKEKNPSCNIRINTNLSTTKTGIFELLCNFKNVHWTVSVESIEAEYEYIRHHASWQNFLDNLKIIREFDHKISFNMLHFILNYDSIFGCVDYLKGIGFNDNSFIIGPLYSPRYYNILNLPDVMIDNLKVTLKQKLEQSPTGYLKNSYQNLLMYYTSTPWKKNIDEFLHTTKIQDERRNVSCRKIFRELFAELDA